MNEREWEMYRLSVVQSMPDSPYKRAIVEGIYHRLQMLQLTEALASSSENFR